MSALAAQEEEERKVISKPHLPFFAPFALLNCFFFSFPFPSLRRREVRRKHRQPWARGGARQEGTASEVNSLPLEPRRFLARAGRAQSVTFHSYKLIKWL